MEKFPRPAPRSAQDGAIRYFVGLAQQIGLPRSLGEIYGLVFTSAEPVHFQTVVKHLDLSKGAASQGLRFLQRVGAIRAIRRTADRRTYYEPELVLRRVVAGFLEQTVRPRLENGLGDLSPLEALVSGRRAADLAPAEAARLRDRVETLRRWRDKAHDFLPLLSLFLEGASGLGPLADFHEAGPAPVDPAPSGRRTTLRPRRRAARVGPRRGSPKNRLVSGDPTPTLESDAHG